MWARYDPAHGEGARPAVERLGSRKNIWERSGWVAAREAAAQVVELESVVDSDHGVIVGARPVRHLCTPPNRCRRVRLVGRAACPVNLNAGTAAMDLSLFLGRERYVER